MYRNGDQYVGQIKAEEISSPNTLEALPTVQRHGRGEFIGQTFNYFGGFSEDKMDGFGVMVFNNSMTERQYYGSFSNDRKCGYGVMMYRDGGFFSGMFVNDVRCGQGTLHLSNGDVIEGTWDGDEIKNGVFKKGNIQNTPLCTRLLIYEQGTLPILN
jgi:hypothetical protein